MGLHVLLSAEQKDTKQPCSVLASFLAVEENDPAVEQYETVKRHIHIQLVNRLDMNRVSEMDPKTLRNEIRSIAEQLCDTENQPSKHARYRMLK